MKLCRGCERSLPKSAFGSNRASSDGLYYRCKECRLAYDKAWREANRDKDRAGSARWREAHPERARERIVVWREANDRKPHDASYRERNGSVIRSHAHRRRLLIAEAFIEDVDIVYLFERDRGICGICRLEVDWDMASIDHVIPVSKGGEHSYANTQLAHRRCNSGKKDKI